MTIPLMEQAAHEQHVTIPIWAKEECASLNDQLMICPEITDLNKIILSSFLPKPYKNF